jgi:hypothetical protein
MANMGLLQHVFAAEERPDELHALAKELLHIWSAALLQLQVSDKHNPATYGGIWCPADQMVHGRCGDAIYPLMHLAHTTGEAKYTDAAQLLYQWMENNVSQPDGSWLNEKTPGAWKGTTVFYAIALAETLKYHGHLLDPAWKKQIEERINKAGEFIFTNFYILYGNINYPVTGAYGLCLLGEQLDQKKFTEKGRQLAAQVLPYFTEHDTLLYGEGDLENLPSPKGCQAIDLGYNVEESLPSLLQYALLMKEEDMLARVKQSMHRHLLFMLPDGGWDNSWGTRNYKWTYWGSRTSDGCQAAYGLLAEEDPVFYKAALQNTKLMRACTHEGLLTGGPHYAAQHVPVCAHHTFTHIKALATMLDHRPQPVKVLSPGKIILPREKENTAVFIKDIQTWLVSKGKYRATVTAYDKEYKKTKNAHATGGALSMLWHTNAGILLCASMTEYQLIEAGNMQKDNDPHSMPLTPRMELWTGNKVYRNISDLAAGMEVKEEKDRITIVTYSSLVNGGQQHPPSGAVPCKVSYTFSEEGVTIRFECNSTQPVGIIVPMISEASEKYTVTGNTQLMIQKKASRVLLTSDQPMSIMPVTGSRIFNYVPGLQAIPLLIASPTATIRIQTI